MKTHIRGMCRRAPRVTVSEGKVDRYLGEPDARAIKAATCKACLRAAYRRLFGLALFARHDYHHPEMTKKTKAEHRRDFNKWKKLGTMAQDQWFAVGGKAHAEARREPREGSEGE
jgi:hypothetical protein